MSKIHTVSVNPALQMTVAASSVVINSALEPALLCRYFINYQPCPYAVADACRYRSGSFLQQGRIEQEQRKNLMLRMPCETYGWPNYMQFSNPFPKVEITIFMLRKPSRIIHKIKPCVSPPIFSLILKLVSLAIWRTCTSLMFKITSTTVSIVRLHRFTKRSLSQLTLRRTVAM